MARLWLGLLVVYQAVLGAVATSSVDVTDLGLGEGWIDAMPAAALDDKAMLKGSLYFDPGPEQEQRELGEGGSAAKATNNSSNRSSSNATKPTPFSSSAAAPTVFWFPHKGCVGKPSWQLEAKTACRSEKLIGNGMMRVKVCATPTSTDGLIETQYSLKNFATIIGQDSIVLLTRMPNGCLSDWKYQQAIQGWNHNCRNVKYCQNCQTVPSTVCVKPASDCVADKDFDPAFYVKTNPGIIVPNVNVTLAKTVKDPENLTQAEKDKLTKHWSQYGVDLKLLGCDGCCPGKAILQSCEYSDVGCNRERAAEEFLETLETAVGPASDF